MIIGYIKREDDTKAIMYWDNYGIVCPSLLTSNGNIQMVADAIKFAIKKGYNYEEVNVDGEIHPFILKFREIVDEEVLEKVE